VIGTQARDRVAISLKTGIVGAVGCFLVLVLGVLTFFEPTYHFVASQLGYAPSLAAGQPFGEIIGILAYAAAAWFGLHHLRKARTSTRLRIPTRAELLLFAGTLILMIVLDSIDRVVISALGHGSHVQAGFEGFSVKMHSAAGTALAIALTALGAVVFAPFTEELAIRGLLFGGLASRLGVLPAAILSGIIFAALHGDPVYFTIFAVEGCILALSYAATGNLLIPIALHGSLNAISLCFAIPQSLAH
jgi:membrane protease YdiL (CAAX protease family)